MMSNILSHLPIFNLFSSALSLIITTMISAVMISAVTIGCSVPRASSAPSVQLSPQDPPASVEELKPLLSARHSRDVPAMAGLSHIEGHDVGLLWLARYGNPLAVRARALRLLGELPTDDALDVLMERAAELNRPSVRAAAIKATSAHLRRASGARLEVLIMLIKRSDSPSAPRRVRFAAQEVMRIAPDLFPPADDPNLNIPGGLRR